jgi:hypothetical protein
MTTKRTDQVQPKARLSKSSSANSAQSPKRRGRVLMMPAIMNTVAISEYARFLGEVDASGLLNAMTDETKRVRDGDLSYVEAMLLGQATTLQTVFVNLLSKATSESNLKHWEAFLRFGLKAQNQCRMTLETLATIKNPPVVFAKQTNIANGPQQVNNNVPSEANSLWPHAPAENSKIMQTELLERSDEQRMDTGTTCAAVGADTHMEALGSVDRTAKR